MTSDIAVQTECALSLYTYYNEIQIY